VLRILQILCEAKEEKYPSFKLKPFKAPEKTSRKVKILSLGGRIVLPCFWCSGQNKALLCNLPPMHTCFLWEECLLCSKLSFSLANALGLLSFSRAHGHSSPSSLWRKPGWGRGGCTSGSQVVCALIFSELYS